MYAGEFIIKELSVWMIVDLNTSQGRQMTVEAIKYSVSISYSVVSPMKCMM